MFSHSTRYIDFLLRDKKILSRFSPINSAKQAIISNKTIVNFLELRISYYDRKEARVSNFSFLAVREVGEISIIKFQLARRTDK